MRCLFYKDVELAAENATTQWHEFIKIRPQQIAVGDFLCVFDGLQCGGQLVGAGGLLHAALDALQTGDDIVDIHTFHQTADAFQIAVAAAVELDIGQLIVFHIKADHLGAGSLGLKSVLHFIRSFLG